MKMFGKKSNRLQRFPLLILYTILSPLYFGYFFIKPPIDPYSSAHTLYRGMKDIILLSLIVILLLRYTLKGKLISNNSAPIIGFILYALIFSVITLISGEADVIDSLTLQGFLLYPLTFHFFIGELQHAHLRIDTVISWIIKVGIVVAVIGLIESLFLGVRQTYFAGYRAASTMFHPNIFGWMMGFCSVLAYIEFQLKRQRKAWIMVAILFLMAAVVSGSRSAVILPLSTMMVLLLVSCRRYAKKAILFLLLLVLISSTVLFLEREFPNIEKAVSRQSNFFLETGFEDLTVQKRVNHFRISIAHLICPSSVLLGKYAYEKAQRDVVILVTDNFYLQLWANYGLFGLIIFVGAVGTVLLRVHRRLRGLPLPAHIYNYRLALLVANNFYFLSLGMFSKSIGNFPLGLFYWLINAGLLTGLTPSRTQNGNTSEADSQRIYSKLSTGLGV